MEERFTEMWRTSHSAGQAVAPKPIPKKWSEEGRSFDELVALRIEVDGEEWAVEFGFKDCGIAPRDDPDFRLDEV
jgi:hypothetical protein